MVRAAAVGGLETYRSAQAQELEAADAPRTAEAVDAQADAVEAREQEDLENVAAAADAGVPLSESEQTALAAALPVDQGPVTESDVAIAAEVEAAQQEVVDEGALAEESVATDEVADQGAMSEEATPPEEVAEQVPLAEETAVSEEAVTPDAGVATEEALPPAPESVEVESEPSTEDVLVSDAVVSGVVPPVNQLRASLKARGVTLRPQAVSAMRNRAISEVAAAYPPVKLPSTTEYKSAKALGLGDLRVGKKQLKIPVGSNQTGVFTNDPHVTALQLSAGLSVPIPKGVTSVNPGIRVSPSGRHVESATTNDGQSVAGPGDYTRLTVAKGEYQSARSDVSYQQAVFDLPEANFGTLEAPVNFHGFQIRPGSTQEADLINRFFGPQVEARVEAIPGLSLPQRSDVVSNARNAFLREIREFMLSDTDAADVDPRGFGMTKQKYSDYLKGRQERVWSKSESEHWNAKGAPTGPEFFIRDEVTRTQAGNDARVVSMATGEDAQVVIDRASARSTDATDPTDALLELVDAEDTASLLRLGEPLGLDPDGLIKLAAAMDEKPALKLMFARSIAAAVQPANRAAFIARAANAPSADILVQVGNTVLNHKEALGIIETSALLRDARALLSPGLSVATDEEVATIREENTATVEDLQLRGDFREALSRIARVTKYPRRYRAIVSAALKMEVLPTLNLVDLPVEGYAGIYSPSTHSINLNLAATNGRGLLDVLAHELLHASTHRAIQNPQTKKARLFRNRLEKARAAMAENTTTWAYATQSLDEFVTHAATNPTFQRAAAETVTAGRNVWQRIVDAVSSFFGIANKSFVSDLWGFINHTAEHGYRPDLTQAESAPPLASPAAAPNGIRLPELPSGLRYEYDDSADNFLAYVTRRRPAVVTVNREALKRLTEGLDPANAQAVYAKTINHELAHLAGFSTFSDADIQDMASKLSLSQVKEVAARYYGPAGGDPMERFQVDLESGEGLDAEMLLEEWFRIQLEKVTTGGTTEEAIAFHLTDPGFLDRVLRYFKEAIAQLWARVGGPDADYATRVDISRLTREYRALKNGRRIPIPEPGFRNPDLGALNPETRNPQDVDAAILEALQLSTEDFSQGYDPGSMWNRLFNFRTGDARFPRVADTRKQIINAAEARVKSLSKRMNRAIKSESPDTELVNQALGSREPSVSDAQKQVIAETYAEAIAAAEAMNDADQQTLAVKEASEMRNRMELDALIESNRQVKRVIADAQIELEKVAPETYKAVKEAREAIDGLSKQLADWMPTGSPLAALLNEQLGVYVTRTYRIHHSDGNPLDILKDPELQEAVVEAQNELLKDYVESRGQEIIDERANLGEIMSEEEAQTVARAEADQNGLAIQMLEDFILSHGSRALYHGGSNFRTDLTRYMRKGEVPEALRTIMDEVTDPTENMARTLLNVSYLAASNKFVADLARLGKESGGMLNASQVRAYRPMIQATEDTEFVSQALDAGFATKAKRQGYIEIGEDLDGSPAYAPAWIVKAREARDLTLIDGFRPVATSSKRYGAGKLADMYAHPEIAEWMQFVFKQQTPSGMADQKFLQKMSQLFAGATGMSLAIATLGSVGFYPRNIVDGAGSLMANGINPFSPKSLRAGKLAWAALVESDNPWTTKLIAKGILADDLRPLTIKELTKEITDRPGGLNLLEAAGKLIAGKQGIAAGRATSAAAAKLADLASAIDGWAKATAFFAELETQQKAYADDNTVTQAAMEDAAERIVKRTFQARSQTMPIAESASNSAYGRLFAPFLRFKSDVLRVTRNVWLQSAEERKSDNPVIRRRGYERLAGYTAAATFSIAGPAFISSLMGIGEEEEKALRASLPTYLRGNSIIYQLRDDGSITSYDFTYLNKFSFVGDPISRMGRALLDGDPGQAADEVSIWFAGQFLDEQILAGAANEVLKNQSSDGRPIVLGTDNFDDKVLKYTKHLVSSAYTPAVLKNMQRSYDAARRGVPEDAAFFETPVGILAGHAAPMRPRNFKSEDLALRAFRNVAQINREVRGLGSQLKRRVNYTEGDLAEIVEDMHASAQGVAEQRALLARAYEKMGVPKPQLVKAQVASGLSRSTSKGIVFYGRATAPNLSPAARRDIYAAGEAAGGKGGGERRLKAIKEASDALPRVFDVRRPD